MFLTERQRLPKDEEPEAGLTGDPRPAKSLGNSKERNVDEAAGGQRVLVVGLSPTCPRISEKRERRRQRDKRQQNPGLEQAGRSASFCHNVHLPPPFQTTGQKLGTFCDSFVQIIIKCYNVLKTKCRL